MKHAFRWSRWLLGGLMLAGCAPSWAAQHALLIGIGDYDYKASGLNDLPGARHDVSVMKDVLVSRLGFRPEEIRTLVDAEATHTGLRDAFAGLAKAVQPGDFVYVHYSGHGSLVEDYNDNERSGSDQTLVSYGARQADATGLDRFDILDDEVNAWLAPIADKAGELVFVADACHSATNTRGDGALVARAAPADTQPEHPLAHDPGERRSLGDAVLIGAARDDQSAVELQLKDGTRAGAFTESWAAALERANPSDTWRRIFERASQHVALEYRSAQNPQIAGDGADRQILGGKLDPRAGILVRKVQGSTVTLAAGRLAGVTVGSLYATSDTQDAPRVRIREVRESECKGEIETGTLTAGAFLVEREHAYETEPLKLFLLPSTPERDAASADALRQGLANLPGFQWTDSQAEADLVLAVLRPQRIDGEPRYSQTPQGRSTLPVDDPNAAPEVWVLTPAEQLLHGNLATRLDSAGEGLTTLARNLERYRRVIELKRLFADTAGGLGVRVRLIRYDTCAPQAAGCFHVADTDTWHKRVEGSVPIDQLGRSQWEKDTLVSFVLENPGLRDRNVYLLELDPDGSVDVIFPRSDMNAAAALLRSGDHIELPDEDIAMVLSQTGNVSLLVLATQLPIDPRLLTQSGYQMHRGSNGSRIAANPLERLLADAVQGGNTRAGVSIGTGTWGGTVVDFRVQ